MTAQKSDMSKTIDKNNFKQEALYKSPDRQWIMQRRWSKCWPRWTKNNSLMRRKSVN